MGHPSLDGYFKYYKQENRIYALANFEHLDFEKMTAHEAIEKSISKWKFIRYLEDYFGEPIMAGGGKTCALCKKYDCVACPIKVATGETCREMNDSHNEASTMKQALLASDRMIELLNTTLKYYETPPFTKSDLKSGMTVTLRDGDKFLVVLETKIGDALLNTKIFDFLDNYSENMINVDFPHLDIVKVEQSLNSSLLSSDTEVLFEGNG